MIFCNQEDFDSSNLKNATMGVSDEVIHSIFIVSYALHYVVVVFSEYFTRT